MAKRMSVFAGAMSGSGIEGLQSRLSHYDEDTRSALITLFEGARHVPGEDREWVVWNALKELFPDFYDWIENNLWIATKRKGQVARLVFNHAQLKLNEVFREEGLRDRAAKVIILKARQLGMSTAIQGNFFSQCALSPGTMALTIGNKKDTAVHLMRMSRRYLSNLWAAPDMEEDGKFGIAFAHDSRMAVETAGAAEAMGRSTTTHLLHLSELGFWPDPEGGMVAVMQTQGDFQGCMTVIESTANGRNHLYALWQAAAKGQLDYVPLFFPWFADPEYRIILTTDEQDALREDLSDTEDLLMKRFDLDLEQMAWRRATIKNKCGMSEAMFQQEYPSFPAEAFLHSTAPVFDQQKIEAAYELVEVPSRYDIVWRS